MSHRTPARALAAVALAAAALLTGCASQTTFDDPIAVMLDPTEGRPERWAAIRQAEETLYADPRRIDALQKLVWVRGHMAVFSNYAVDQLVEVDEAAAKEFLNDAIVLVQDWTTLSHIIDTAVARNWVDFTPALVRSYAMTTPIYNDMDRPERAALQKLRPDTPPEEIVLEVFVDGEKMEVRQRTAAWQLMNRLATDRQALIDRLLSLDPKGDALVTDLQAGARDLNILPDNMEQVTWLRMLRTDPAYWASAQRAVESLGPEQRRGVALRHLPILIYLADEDPATLSKSHAELMAIAHAHDVAAKHWLKGPTFDGPMSEYPQRLLDWRDKLLWADLATLVSVQRWMADEGVVRQWFKQADADAEDKSTEYGGLMLRNENGRAYPRYYASTDRRHDLKYIPPSELILDSYTALAHYHYHAQEKRNRRYAGPGVGDMKFADRHQLNNLVLTFIDPDTLNVDYYHGPDVVIDLGVVER